MLSTLDIKIEDLILDPNNPRFVRDFSENARVPEEELVASEKETLKNFSIDLPDSDEDTTNSHDLYKSMLNIGYVAIDRVVVRRIADTDKYLVIEGNRRISTVKKLLQALDSSDDSLLPGKKYGANKEALERHRASLELIPCKVLETQGVSTEEVARRISLILGIRHHGSLLEWEPLPRAYNIYNEYMNIDGASNDDFRVDNKKIEDVSARLSIEAAKVRSALKTYIAYLQLSEHNPAVKDRHYSLIESAVNSKPLSSNYLESNKLSYRLEDESLERMDELCQFAVRDNSNFSGKKIIADPKAMNRFGQLIKKQHEQQHAEATNYIKSQVDQLLDQESELTLEQALDNVTDYVNRTKWVEAVDALLDQREQKLEFSDYTGTSNDLAAKESLKVTLSKIIKVID